MSGNGKIISYKYNDAGIRTEKTVDGVVTKYHLIGNKVSYEDNRTDKIYYTYDANSKLISMNLNGIEYYYIKNGQGDIIGLFDASGAEVVKYTYDTWGKLISITGVLADTVGVKNPYRYREYRYDTETGLYYLQSRYYNPAWGRFINADALIGRVGVLLSHNLFAYCRNNPINRVDPLGYDDVEGDGPGKGTGAGTPIPYNYGNTYLGKYIRSSWNSLTNSFKGTSNSVNILGKGSTGRTVANNLNEELAMKEVMSNPLEGAKQLKSVTMTDKRWLAEDGWVKMSENVNGTEIHYVCNTKTGAFDDFKFK